MKRMILMRGLKCWVLDLKIILLDRQNNFVKTLTIISNAAKNFDILTTSLIILIVRQN